MKFGVVILAAGQGTRMKSSLPKVLHPLAGKPMLAHVIETAQQLDPQNIVVVYGHGGDQVKQQMQDYPVSWALQEQQLGTGHALKQAMPELQDVDHVLVLYGDVPMIRAETLQQLLEAEQETAFSMLTVEVENPSGYGRIVRDEYDRINRIVEEKDASIEELRIREINVGIMTIAFRELETWLSDLNNNNAQQEFYLTDIVAMAVNDGHVIASAHPASVTEVEGVNDRVQLARLERDYQRIQAEAAMRAGATLNDPARIDIRGELIVAQDVTIDINTVFEGKVELAEGVRIGANCVLRNCSIAEQVTILENCVIEDAVIGEGCRIGPFARIRPGTELAKNCHVGNFVELKNAQVDIESKINHLSYVGDTSVGKSVNIGAGTITCNYDGAFKHRTVIGDNAFIGSDTQLVAPVEIGSGATIGAGSTITKNAPSDKLTVCRANRQMTVENWKRPQKEKQ